MKKNFWIFAFSFFIFTSCHDAIYDMINSEVKLEKHGINGDITSIVHFKDYIYLCNGKIYKKTNQPSSVTGEMNKQWRSVVTPDNSIGDNRVPATVAFLASDGEFLYALSYSWGENNKGYNEVQNVNLFATNNGESWTSVDYSSLSDGSKSYGHAKIIFDNQVVRPAECANGSYTFDYENRRAFIKIFVSNDECRIFKLNGTGIPTEFSPTFLDSETKVSDVVCAVNFRGNDVFSKYYAVAATENFIYYSTSTISSTHVSGSSDLCYLSDVGAEPTKVALDCSSILSLAPASNYILLGTASGLAHIRISKSGIPEKSIANFSTNGGSILSEYVFKVFILDPTKLEDSNSVSSGTDEYAAVSIYGSVSSSSVSWDDTGLYAWYPKRAQWNRDGTDDTVTNGN